MACGIEELACSLKPWPKLTGSHGDREKEAASLSLRLRFLFAHKLHELFRGRNESVNRVQQLPLAINQQSGRIPVYPKLAGDRLSGTVVFCVCLYENVASAKGGNTPIRIDDFVHLLTPAPQMRQIAATTAPPPPRRPFTGAIQIGPPRNRGGSLSPNVRPRRVH